MAMTKAEKRVAIAKDVIAQVKVGRFKAATGNYVQAKTGPVTLGAGMQEALVGKECSVCALGAAFVAGVDRFNKLNLTVWNTGIGNFNAACGEYERENIDTSGEDTRDYLSRYFGIRQMDAIESAFEGWSSEDDRFNFGRCATGSSAFFRAHPVATDRLLAIMRNIIRNGGEFVMPKKYIKAEARS